LFLYPAFTIRAQPSPGMKKGLIFLLAIFLALWATGVDLHGVKEWASGVSSGNARSMTGRDRDWD